MLFSIDFPSLILAESEEEEFFECTSEEPANEDDLTLRTQQKASHLLWNKPAGRLAKHPTLKYEFLAQSAFYKILFVIHQSTFDI